MELVATLSGHTDGVNTLAVLDDGARLASGSHDRTIRVREKLGNGGGGGCGGGVWGRGRARGGGQAAGAEGPRARLPYFPVSPTCS